MGIQILRERVLPLNEQPATMPPVVQAVEAQDYEIGVALTCGNVLPWLEGLPRGVSVQRSTGPATEIGLLCAHQLWARRVPRLVVTALPAPVARRQAREERAVTVVPRWVSSAVLCHTSAPLRTQEEA
jgi:hypothetical protein